MPTRVALLDLPGLLADVVLDAFAGEPDIEVAVLPAGSTARVILDGRPDVVMVAVPNPEFYAPSEVLLRHQPGLGLFAISPDAREAWIHELCPCSHELTEVTGPTLRAAVRRVAERSRVGWGPR